MSFITAYPLIQSAFFKYLNMELSGDQSAEDAELYAWLDDMIDVCFAEAESYCGQPLRTSVVNYQFTHSQARHGLESDHRWKYIPYSANTALTGFQWRENEFAAWSNVSAGNYAFTTDNGMNFVIYRNINNGQFKATISTGFTDANSPKTIIQGIVEMLVWIYKHSANGGNWFGLTSVATSGAGQNVSQSLVTNLDWQKYFAKYRIAVV